MFPPYDDDNAILIMAGIVVKEITIQIA